MIPHLDRSYSTAVAILLSALLSACSIQSNVPAQPLPPVTDRSPFTGIPCKAPCWHGLVIGKSSESEVRSTVQSLGFLDQANIAYRPRSAVPDLAGGAIRPGLEIDGNCLRPPQQCVALYVGYVLTQVKIWPNYQISASEVVAAWGPPDYVGSQLLGAEILTCQIELVWHTPNIVVNSVPQSWHSSDPSDRCVALQRTGRITSDLVIQALRYMSSERVDYALHQSGSNFFKFTGMSAEQ